MRRSGRGGRHHGNRGTQHGAPRCFLNGGGEEPPFARVADIRPHLIQARVEGASLDPRSLWQIYETLQAARLLRAFFHREREAAPLLWKRASGLVSPEALCTAIAEAITPEGEVSDAASPGRGRGRRGVRARPGAAVTGRRRPPCAP